MGEDMNEMMNLRIFADGKEVGFATMAQVEPLTVEAEPTEDDDVWTHTFSLTASGTLTADAETVEGMRRMMESMRIGRRERRRMFHAVTHGGAVVIPSYIKVEHDNGETEEFPRTVYINRPAVLRRMIADCHGFRFRYDIVQHFDPTDNIVLSEIGNREAYIS